MNEVLLIYLYGIYPENGATFIASIYLIVLATILGLIAGPFEEVERAKKIMETMSIYTKIAIATIIIGYFIPSKNIFLAMVATPSIIESLESKTGKLNKIDKLLDKALDKALNEFNENNNTGENNNNKRRSKAFNEGSI